MLQVIANRIYSEPLSAGWLLEVLVVFSLVLGLYLFLIRLYIKRFRPHSGFGYVRPLVFPVVLACGAILLFIAFREILPAPLDKTFDADVAVRLTVLSFCLSLFAAMIVIGGACDRRPSSVLARICTWFMFGGGRRGN